MIAKWFVLAVAAVALASLSCSTAAGGTTCAGMEMLVGQSSANFHEEVQLCAPYIVSKCCGEEGGCSPGDGFDECYRECGTSLLAAGDEVLLKCSKAKRSLFLRRRLRRRKRRPPKRKVSKRGRGKTRRKSRGKTRRSRRRTRPRKKKVSTQRRRSKRKVSKRGRGKTRRKSRGKTRQSRSKTQKTGRRKNRRKRRSDRGPVAKNVRRRKRRGTDKKGRDGRRRRRKGGNRDNDDDNDRRRKKRRGKDDDNDRRRKKRRGNDDNDDDDNDRRRKKRRGNDDDDDDDNDRRRKKRRGHDDDDEYENEGYGDEGYGDEGYGDEGYGDEGHGDEGHGDEGTPFDSDVSVNRGDTRPGTGSSILALARRKVEELNEFEDFVCKTIGTMPKSEFCWMKNGNQREVGGRCKAPKDCLIYEMPLFYPTNQIHTWKHPRGATLEQLKGTAFRNWGLTDDLLQKIRMGAFFDQASSADAYVFVAVPKKATATFKLEIIHVTTDGFGRITSAVFTRLENKGWMVQPRICQWATSEGVGSGTRHCSNRGLTEAEINTVKSTLELHAWKLIIQRLTGADKTCNPEFNCFCYMQKNPKVENELGGSATCLNGMFHYLNEGKKQGLDGSCCVRGQSKARPERKAEVTYGECKNWDYKAGAVVTEGKVQKTGAGHFNYPSYIKSDSGRGDIGMHCAGIFKCDGDLLWCPAKSCTGGNDYKRGKNWETNEMSSQTKKCAEHCVGDRNVDFRRLFTSRDYHGEKTGDQITEDGKHIRGRLLGKKKKKKKKKSSSYFPYGKNDDSDGDGPGAHQEFGRYGKQSKKKSKYTSYGRGGYGGDDDSGSSRWTNSHARGITKITTRSGVCEAASDGDKDDYKDCMRCMDECSGCKNTCKCSDTDPITKDQMKALGNINRLRDIF